MSTRSTLALLLCFAIAHGLQAGPDKHAGHDHADVAHSEAHDHEHDHEHEHEHDDADHHDHDHGSMETAPAPLPETLESLWIEMTQQHQTLSDAVTRGEIPSAHAAETRLQACLQHLPALLETEDESKRDRILGQARNLQRVYDEIHIHADEANWSEARARLKTADAVRSLLALHLGRSP